MFVDQNSILKLKIQGLHPTFVNNVNASDIIDFLFQKRVLVAQDMRALHQKNDAKQQCRDLLALVHTSENPQAFVHLYRAIKTDPHLQWLIEQIDEYSDQTVIDLLQRCYISNRRGEYQSTHSFTHSMSLAYATSCLSSVYSARVFCLQCFDAVELKAIKCVA